VSGERKEGKHLHSSGRRAADARGGRPTGHGSGRRPRAFRPLRWAWLLLLVALLAPTYDLFLPAGYRPPPEHRTVVIERGESLHEIAHELQRAGVIRSQAGFLVLARMMRLDRSVKAGQYSFRLGVTVPSLLRALDRGMYGLNLVTIPEGLMVSETATLLQREIGIRAVAIDSLAKDPATLDSLEVGAPSLEGWLAPDSYEWLPGTSPEVILRTMVGRTRERVQHATAGYDSLPLGMNAHEVLTLASIVESESRAQDERPHIARVYLNRLDRGMLLQADPTVGYAQGRGPRSRLTFRDLRVESPYNTYRHEGLPPGPICSPGLAAIEAVMNATPGAKDLYFVARGQGHHLFAPTYEQHLANIAFVRGKQAALAARNNPDASSEATPDTGGPDAGGTNAPLAASGKHVPGAAAKAGLGKPGLHAHSVIKDAAATAPVGTLVPTATAHATHADSARAGTRSATEVGPAPGPIHLAPDSTRPHVHKHAAAAGSGAKSALATTSEAATTGGSAKPAIHDSTAYKAAVLPSTTAKSAVHDSTSHKAGGSAGVTTKSAVHDSTSHKAGGSTGVTSKSAVHDSTSHKAGAAAGVTAKSAVHDSTSHKAGGSAGVTAKSAVHDSTSHKSASKAGAAKAATTAADTTHKAGAKAATKSASSSVKPPAAKATADTTKAAKGQ
jgi:UPF0755 protein